MIKQGDIVMLMSTPRQETEYLIGKIGVVKRLEINGLFEVRFGSFGSMICADDMVSAVEYKDIVERVITCTCRM